jgi:ABC-type dipeptide/oligopeptide/nickel transport system permease component
LSACSALTGVSMPIFWLGVMLAWVFASSFVAADRLRGSTAWPTSSRGHTSS